MIELKIQLANATQIDMDEINEHINDSDELTLFMDKKVLVHPTTLSWIESPQLFEHAERDNEEDSDGNGGGYLPYVDTGELARDHTTKTGETVDEDDYYYQVSDIEWEGETEFEEYVANWMNENPESYKDLITHGCISGMIPDLLYHNQILECLRDYKRDLENIIQEIADNLGDMGFLFGQCQYNSNDFSFDRLIWMCFEETVRQTLSNLDLDDI